ncbi:MAG: ABC transporter permease [Acidobacteria bacterium]|nr:ABC transporter permease [Acidobacteriota bacterium]
MNWVKEMARRLRYLANRRRMEAELEEEMRLHQELRAESMGGAEEAARRKFGNETLIREDSGAVWGWGWLDSLWQDVRYALRAMAAHPVFTVTAVLSLALGIGANTAIFSILNAVMMRSLPVKDPQRLVQVRMGESGSFTNPLWEEIRDRQSGFDGALAYSAEDFDLASGGEVRYVNGMFVSGGYFQVLGVGPYAGRMLSVEDDLHGGGRQGPVAVLSHAFWKSQYGGDPGIVGRSIRLNRKLFQIVGVAPAWFRGLDVDRGFDVAVPIGCQPMFSPDRSWLQARSTWWLRVVGRLPEGMRPEQAEARLSALAPEINKATLPSDWDPRDQKDYLQRTFRLKPAQTGFSSLRSTYQKALYTLMGLVGIVLLIACVNIANLMLARAAARQREFSIRLAIGAGRWRLVRQLLTESVMLSTLGAVAGTVFASWGSGALVGFFSSQRDRLSLELAPDWRVLAFTTSVALLTGLLFGLAPALRGTRVAPNSVLKEGMRGMSGVSARFRLGKTLVAVQVALSLVLLVGAGLFVGSFQKLMSKGDVFHAQELLMARVDTLQKIPKEQRLATYQAVLERLRAMPGVQSAASAMVTPLQGMQWNNEVFPQDFQPKTRRDSVIWFNRVSPGYFQTMNLAVVLGRDFESRDTASSSKVIILDESTARHFFGQKNPLGRTIGIDNDAPPHAREQYEVIGVVRDATYASMRERNSRTGYLAAAQDGDPWGSMFFLARAAADRDGLAAAVRSALTQVNPGLSLVVRRYDEVIGESLTEERTVALLSSFFGGLALLLAMIGLYGVNAYSVARRQGEIGIRLALGASRGSVVRLVLSDVVLVLAGGLTLGVGAVLAAGRLVESLLFGVQPVDSWTLAGAAAVLSAAALFAAYLPARRASKLDPMTTLREE